MKNIFRSILAVAVVALSVAACNVDNIKEVYLPSDNEVSFVQSTVVSTEINAKATNFDIEVSRTNTNGILQIPVDGSKLPAGVTCAANVTFADGEAKAALSLNVSAMEVGKQYKGSVSLVPANDANGYQEHIAITTANVTLAKAYTWIELGKGQIYDGLALQPSADDLGIMPVTVQQAEGFKRWRIINPFDTKQLQKAWDPAFLNTKQLTTVIEVYALEDGKHLKFDGPIKTGLTYVTLNPEGHIYYYFPSSYSASYAPYDANNILLENDKVIRLYVCQCIENTTSWFGPGAKYISLPGGPDLNKWLLE